MRSLFHLLLLAGALGLAADATAAEYHLEKAFPYVTFSYPTDVQSPSDGTNRVFVVEKSGAIKVFPNDFNAQPGAVKVFLDLSAKVRTSGEAGALGLAFHPKYAQNGTFFVFYVSQFFRATVSRYQVSADPDVADAASETVLLNVLKSTVFHNGGQIAFGADGFLYIGLGDDRTGANAQDLGVLLGALLRIDVDVAPAAAGAIAPNYEIPADNPFAGNAMGYREEIFAYGLRNPWRFSADRASGELWVADVGEDNYEEINLVEKGRNYGWPYKEGFACLDSLQCAVNAGLLADPFYSYSHSEGVAVIGGHRYWGPHSPELAGLYIFADYTGGKVWALRFDGAGPPQRFDLVTGAPTMLTFGVGPSRELYVAAIDGYLYRLSRTVTAVGDAATPRASRLTGNFPNPFNPATTIRYQLAEPGRVAIEIISVDGARVRRIEEGHRDSGTHDTAWRGDTDHGGRAASGVYVYRLVVDGVALDARRMVLLK